MEHQGDNPRKAVMAEERDDEQKPKNPNPQHPLNTPPSQQNPQQQKDPAQQQQQHKNQTQK